MACWPGMVVRFTMRPRIGLQWWTPLEREIFFTQGLFMDCRLKPVLLGGLAGQGSDYADIGEQVFRKLMAFLQILR